MYITRPCRSAPGPPRRGPHLHPSILFHPSVGRRSHPSPGRNLLHSRGPHLCMRTGKGGMRMRGRNCGTARSCTLGHNKLHSHFLLCVTYYDDVSTTWLMLHQTCDISGCTCSWWRSCCSIRLTPNFGNETLRRYIYTRLYPHVPPCTHLPPSAGRILPYSPQPTSSTVVHTTVDILPPDPTATPLTRWRHTSPRPRQAR